MATVMITSCYDGDTCSTSSGEKIRLACIDAPELRGRNKDPIPAADARDYLNSLAKGRVLIVRRYGKDRYNRTIAELELEDRRSVNELMVDKGHAKISEQYAWQCDWYKRRLLRESLWLRV